MNDNHKKHDQTAYYGSVCIFAGSDFTYCSLLKYQIASGFKKKYKEEDFVYSNDIFLIKGNKEQQS